MAAVINLRSPDDSNYSPELEAEERREVEAAGIRYYSIPIPRKTVGKGELSEQTFQKIHEVIEKHRDDGQIFLHCTTGNRAASWFAWHLHEHHGVEEEKALETARKAGLEKKRAVRATKKLLRME